MDATTEKFLESVSRDLYYIANAQLCAKITCRSCRRCVITKADALLHLSRERRWKTDTKSIGERMKCQSCGHRGAIIKATMEAASVDPVGQGMRRR
ncbi:hypothetical protein GCM10007897_41320 [Sphingobium jiangsuense]|nr:hypothetical protein GCM10007897_41320 [Sphingobium jiangsuense]